MLSFAKIKMIFLLVCVLMPCYSLGVYLHNNTMALSGAAEHVRFGLRRAPVQLAWVKLR